MSHVGNGQKWSQYVTVSLSSGQIFVGLVPNHTFAPKMEEIEHVRIKEFKYIQVPLQGHAAEIMEMISQKHKKDM